MTSISFGNTNSGVQVGIVNGTVNYMHPGSVHNRGRPKATLTNRLLEQPETATPLSTVPFRRDPDFVDCGILLDQIQEKGSTQGARIALIGLGGVG